MVILDDADVESTAEGAVRASFSNAGQLCVATERIYVVEPLFSSRSSEPSSREPEAIRLGKCALTSTHDMGSLINHDQLERVRAHVEDARARVRRYCTGGRHREDLGELFSRAHHVLTDVTPEMDCYAQEAFGPVVSVYPVASEEEAVAQANDSDYGLNASVWTTDHDRGRGVASKIKCGTVNV